MGLYTPPGYFTATKFIMHNNIIHTYKAGDLEIIEIPKTMYVADKKTPIVCKYS